MQNFIYLFEFIDLLTVSHQLHIKFLLNRYKCHLRLILRNTQNPYVAANHHTGADDLGYFLLMSRAIKPSPLLFPC